MHKRVTFQHKWAMYSPVIDDLAYFPANFKTENFQALLLEGGRNFTKFGEDVDQLSAYQSSFSLISICGFVLKQGRLNGECGRKLIPDFALFDQLSLILF